MRAQYNQDLAADLPPEAEQIIRPLLNIYAVDNFNQMLLSYETMWDTYYSFLKHKVLFIKAFSLAVLEGVTASLFGLSIAHVLEYSLLNLESINTNSLLGKMIAPLLSFLGISVMSYLKDTITEQLVNKAGQDFYNKSIIRQKTGGKAIIRMQAEGVDILKTDETVEKYKAAARTFLSLILNIVKNMTYSWLLFAMMSASTAPTLAAAFTTGLVYTVISTAIGMFATFSQMFLTKYYADQCIQVNEAKSKLTEHKIQTERNPILFRQANVDATNELALKRLQEKITIEERKLVFKGALLSISNKSVITLTIISRVVPDLFAIYFGHLTIIKVLAKYIGNLTVELISNSSGKLNEDQQKMMPRLSEVSKDLDKLNIYANKRSNILGGSYGGDIVLSRDFALKAGVGENQAELFRCPNGISFAPGKIHVIEGNSGSGKTTLVNAIDDSHHLFDGGIILPDDICYNRKAIQQVSQRGWQKIPGTTLYESLTDGIDISTPEKKDLVDKELNNLLQRLGLSDSFNNDRLHSEVESPSGGEEIRLLIVKAVLSRAKVIMLDESLGSISGNNLIEARELLKAYVAGTYDPKSGQATIFSIQHRANKKESALQDFGDELWVIENKILSNKTRDLGISR